MSIKRPILNTDTVIMLREHHPQKRTGVDQPLTISGVNLSDSNGRAVTEDGHLLS